MKTQVLETLRGLWWITTGERIPLHPSGSTQYGDGARFTPGQPLPPNTLRLLEQVPGMTHQAQDFCSTGSAEKKQFSCVEADITTELTSRGYWGSFNRPFFEVQTDICKVILGPMHCPMPRTSGRCLATKLQRTSETGTLRSSGSPTFFCEDSYGKLFSFEESPRAALLRRFGGGVSNLNAQSRACQADGEGGL